jgi:hypothetical protein
MLTIGTESPGIGHAVSYLEIINLWAHIYHLGTGLCSGDYGRVFRVGVQTATKISINEIYPDYIVLQQYFTGPRMGNIDLFKRKTGIRSRLMHQVGFCQHF